MKISVAYAMPHLQVVRELELPDGATLDMALRESGLLEEYPEINTAVNRSGIHGRVLPGNTVVQPGDRVEIYRPLDIEPGVARSLRAGKRLTKR